MDKPKESSFWFTDWNMICCIITAWGKYPMNSVKFGRFRFCQNITNYKSTHSFSQKIFITLRSRVQISFSLQSLSTQVERLFCFEAVSKARFRKQTKGKKAKQQTKFIVWKALGKATIQEMTMRSIGHPVKSWVLFCFCVRFAWGFNF
jgi:hypothetical protein